MPPLSSDLLAIALVFTLGLRHGVDPDHLATIDGLTRYNVNRRLAPWCGCLFSLGHGIVVTTIAVGSSMVASRWNIPSWIEDCGVWVSVFFLTLLGLLNLHAVAISDRHEVVRPVGVKSRLLRFLPSAQRPWTVMLVGALFALSFDTLSLAALFSLSASELGQGVFLALGMGLTFTFGMLIADGLNGLWTTHLLYRTGQLTCASSRVMGLTIGSLSLLVAVWIMAGYLWPGVHGWSEGRELLLGAGVVVVVALGFLGSLRIARTQELKINCDT